MILEVTDHALVTFAHEESKPMVAMLLGLLVNLIVQNADTLDTLKLAGRLAGVHTPLRDVEFIYAGEQRLLFRDQKSYPKLDRSFLGNYVYRADGAGYLELYEKLTRGEPELFYGSKAMLGWEVVEAQWNPGRKPMPGWPLQRPGGSQAIGGPEAIFLLPFWEELKRNPALWKVQSKGLVDLNGHSTVLLDIDKYPDTKLAPALKITQRIWLDLNRGGHVLRLEAYQGRHLSYRMDGIELEQFEALDKETIWLPVRGTYHSYRHLDDFRDDPVLEAEYHLVRESVAINQNLSNSRFNITWDGVRRGAEQFNQMRREFDASPPKLPPPIVRLPSDPESIRKYQASQLEEADLQGQRLNASPDGRLNLLGRIGISWFIALLALTALATAIHLRRRAA